MAFNRAVAIQRYIDTYWFSVYRYVSEFKSRIEPVSVYLTFTVFLHVHSKPQFLFFVKTQHQKSYRTKCRGGRGEMMGRWLGGRGDEDCLRFMCWLFFWPISFPVPLYTYCTLRKEPPTLLNRKNEIQSLAVFQ